MYTINCSVGLGTILTSKRCEPWLGKISVSKLRKLTEHLYSKGLIWGKKFVINAKRLINHLQKFVPTAKVPLLIKQSQTLPISTAI